MRNERAASGRWLEYLLHGSRYGLRQLRNNPGFAAVAILTLGLCIVANTAIFTLVYAVLFKSLPVAHPEQLYSFGENPNVSDLTGIQDDFSVYSYPLYRELRDHTAEFPELAAFGPPLIIFTVRRRGMNTC